MLRRPRSQPEPELRVPYHFLEQVVGEVIVAAPELRRAARHRKLKSGALGQVGGNPQPASVSQAYWRALPREQPGPPRLRAGRIAVLKLLASPTSAARPTLNGSLPHEARSWQLVPDSPFPALPRRRRMTGPRLRRTRTERASFGAAGAGLILGLPTNRQGELNAYATGVSARGPYPSPMSLHYRTANR